MEDNLHYKSSSSRRILPIVDNVYDTNHEYRGKAVIFNHRIFRGNRISVREGTENDVKNLKENLLSLGFRESEIIVFDDLPLADIVKELQKVQEEDHTNRDLLMVFVLTHGSNDNQIEAYDIKYSTDLLWQYFTAEKCTTLAEKPKIFFIVACRGEKEDVGFERQSKTESLSEKDSRPFTSYEYKYSIPKQADFLFIYSSYEGYVSYRHPQFGTWYIKAFCDELKKVKISQISFLDLLVSVNQKIAVSYYTVPDEKKQIPTFLTTFTKKLILTPKIFYRESTL